MKLTRFFLNFDEFHDEEFLISLAQILNFVVFKECISASPTDINDGPADRPTDRPADRRTNGPTDGQTRI